MQELKSMKKVYTKSGDSGKTSFFGCGLVQKNDPRIEALGELDELNSMIGVALCFIESPKRKQLLTKIQNDLFTLGADLGGSEANHINCPTITKEYVKELEDKIDILDERLGTPTQFIIPGGTPASSFLHMCRAIARRVERSLVSLKGVMVVNPHVSIYINRLSDLFYMLARDANKETKEQMPIYKFFKSEDE